MLEGVSEMASQETSSEEKENDTNLRRRKFVECAQETFEQATDLIKRKIPCARHFLAPKRLWLKRISTPNCDVVIVFPPNTEDSVLLWLLSKLRQSPGLTVHVRHHASTQCSAFYLTAPFSV
ncbi:hypothetical protein QE152_g33950 [Popillia japonica]|uniref:Uncharacterized protein n=1 Tax=Popillia japonica TaxID=7064 RepID=A0AAW1IV38_POPJA